MEKIEGMSVGDRNSLQKQNEMREKLEEEMKNWEMKYQKWNSDFENEITTIDEKIKREKLAQESEITLAQSEALQALPTIASDVVLPPNPDVNWIEDHKDLVDNGREVIQHGKEYLHHGENINVLEEQESQIIQKYGEDWEKLRLEREEIKRKLEREKGKSLG